jgi:hypothetical protein
MLDIHINIFCSCTGSAVIDIKLTAKCRICTDVMLIWVLQKFYIFQRSVKTRMDLGEVGWGDVDWIGLAQDKDRWRALVNSVLNLRVP